MFSEALILFLTLWFCYSMSASIGVAVIALIFHGMSGYRSYDEKLYEWNVTVTFWKIALFMSFIFALLGSI